jgi:hypothetical protein
MGRRQLRLACIVALLGSSNGGLDPCCFKIEVRNNRGHISRPYIAARVRQLRFAFEITFEEVVPRRLLLCAGVATWLSVR